MGLFSRIITGISGFAGKFASVGVLCLFLLTVFEVFSRRVFNAPTSWTLELQEMLQVTVAMIGISFCLMMEGHVSMDLFLEIMNKRRREIMVIINSLIGAIVCVLIAWISFLSASSSFLMGERTETAGFVIWPGKLAVSIGFGLVALQFISRINQHYISYKRLKAKGNGA